MTLRLKRTKQALAAYDSAAAQTTGQGPVSDAMYEQRERAAVAVGEAFALDTADRNDVPRPAAAPSSAPAETTRRTRKKPRKRATAERRRRRRRGAR